MPRPEELARSAKAKVLLREREPIVRARHRLEARRSLRVPDEDAVTAQLPAPDAAAQLVQLRQTEAFRTKHEHHRSVRHVDADLDHGGGNEGLQLTRGEAPHDLLAAVRRYPAVEQRDGNAAQRARGEVLVRALGRGDLLVLGFLDARAHDERLLAGIEVLLQPRPDAV